MKEVIDVNVLFDILFEDIELLCVEMEKFVCLFENSCDFQFDIGIGVGGIGDFDKLMFKVVIKYKFNWYNDSVCVICCFKFMCVFILVFKKVLIYVFGGGGEVLGGFKNLVYSVVVMDEYVIFVCVQVDKEKEVKRMDFVDLEK